MTCSSKIAITIGNRGTSCVDQEETRKDCLLQFLSMSQCPCLGKQIYVYQPSVFPSPCHWPSSQTTTPNILFCLQLKMIFKMRVLANWVNYSVFLGPSHVYMLLNFCLTFSCSSSSCQFHSQATWKNVEGQRKISFSQKKEQVTTAALLDALGLAQASQSLSFSLPDTL